MLTMLLASRDMEPTAEPPTSMMRCPAKVAPPTAAAPAATAVMPAAFAALPAFSATLILASPDLRGEFELRSSL